MAAKTTTTTEGGADTGAASTEVMIRNGSTALVTPEFAERYPALAPDPDVYEIIQENLGDEEIGSANFVRVKVPSGDLNSWIVDLGEGEESVKELTGVVTAWKARRSMWVDGEPDGSRPDCWSLDNKEPVAEGMYGARGERAADNPTHLCRNCPMNAFGSSAKGSGKACKEQRLLFVAIPGALFPVIIHVPPTSLKAVTQFMVNLMSRKTRYYEVEVGISLEKAKSNAGQAYNRIKVRVIRKLEPGEREAAKVYGAELRDMIEAETARFDSDDFGPAGDGDGIAMPEPGDFADAEAAATT